MKKIAGYKAMLVLLLNSKFLFGQFGFSIETESGYTSNVFANYRVLPDYYTSLSGFLNYDRVNDIQGVRWFYKGSLNAFKQYQNRTFHNHYLGVAYYRDWGENNNRFSAGFDFSKRLHSEDYKWYELQQYYAYVNTKLVLSGQLYGYLGADIRWRNYTLLQAFSHQQSVIFCRFSRFFDTGTTLIFEADFMSKKYSPAGVTSNLEFLPEIVTIGEGASQQFVGIFKAAQALTPLTGLSVQFLLRKNLLSSVRYLGTTTGYYYSDEELFDDVYGYNGEEINAVLKHHLPWKMKMSLGSTLALKHYDNRLALDLEGVPFADERFRADKRWASWLNMEKSMRFSKSMQPITFSLNYTFIINSSNDPYYDYKSGYISLGLSQNF